MSSELGKALILAVYLGLFTVELFWLAKVRKRLGRLSLLEAGSFVLAVVLIFVFNRLPGGGFMPGFTWFYHWVLSWMMAVVYAVLLVITLIVILWRKKKGIKDPSPAPRPRFDYPYISQLIGEDEEKIRALHKRIKKCGVPDMFIVIGTTPYCEECFNLLKREDGKWEVFYGEHGQKSNPRVFDTFEEAGDDLISRF